MAVIFLLPLPSGEREKVRCASMADTAANVGQLTLPSAAAELPVKSRSYWSTVLGRLRRDPVTLACAFILLLIFLSAIFAPLIIGADPYKTSMLHRLQAINSKDHLLGTDELGRDMIARLIYGGRLSLLMGTLPVIDALLVGGLLGIVAGFVGGKLNMLIMRTVDVFYAFPSVLLAIAISGALGAGLLNSIVSLTIVFIPPVTRIAESVTTSVRNLDFVEAARASGASSWTIIRVHVLGNVLGPIFIYATGLISVAIILASGLSFLGLGVKPPEPEWGLMLNTLRQSIWINPVVAALPGAMIFVTSICFNLMSDGLRAAMDIKL
jgi:peptide/nickel transport system permease protein